MPFPPVRTWDATVTSSGLSSSRFGPTWPFAFAALSVWQPEQPAVLKRCAPGDFASASFFDDPPPPQPAVMITTARTAAAGTKRSFTTSPRVLEDRSALEAGAHVLLRHEILAARGAVLGRPVQRADDSPGSFVAAGLPGGRAGRADRDGVLAACVVVRIVAGCAVDAARGVLAGEPADLDGRVRVVLGRARGVAAVGLEARLDPALLGLAAPAGRL